MSPLKRILLILLLLVVAVLIGLGLYYLFTRTNSTTLNNGTSGAVNGGSATLPAAGGRQPTSGTNGSAGQGNGVLPVAGQTVPPTGGNYYQPQPVSQITQDYTVSPSVSSQGNLRYYNSSDGKFYQVLPDGTIKTLSDQVFYDVQSATWAANQDEAVLQYPDGSNVLYNFTNNTQVTLPQNWNSFTFSPQGDQVAAKSTGVSSDNNWLVTTNDDGTGTQLIEPLGDNSDKVIMDWSPSRQVVALSETGQPIGADRQQIIPIGLNGENFQALTVEGLDFQPQWSPSGKQLLYSVDSTATDFKPELWITDAYGSTMDNNRHSLNINTWANKCAFASETTLYCAVPTDLPEGAGMEPAITADTPDNLYKVDLTTGLQTQIPLDSDYTFGTISYDSADNKIIFTDPNQAGAFQVNL